MINQMTATKIEAEARKTVSRPERLCKGRDEWTSNDYSDLAYAVAGCRACPFLEQCKSETEKVKGAMRSARTQSHMYGVWAGKVYGVNSDVMCINGHMVQITGRHASGTCVACQSMYRQDAQARQDARGFAS